MIFPEYFPGPENFNTKNNPERIVYNSLKILSNKYDIFYSTSFHAITEYERPDYEVDFIVIDPANAILLIEVKGGLIEYKGKEKKWYQNQLPMEKAPTNQVLSCLSSLLNRYPDLKKNIPIAWALCFPQCELRNDSAMPANISRDLIIDQRDLLKLPNSISVLMKKAQNEFKYKKGLNSKEYANIKDKLLRGLGFVKRLSTKIEHDEKMYIKFTEEQYAIFKQTIDNKKIVVNGPAGSGKTIIAKELAKESLEKNCKVLLLCFNRTLASTLRADFHINYPNNKNIEISTFHHFARLQIDDSNWFDCNKNDNDFWELLIPEKLESLPDEQLSKFDIIIIDEGQDFKEFWYELLERHLYPQSCLVVFLDSNQDIFNHYTKLHNEQQYTSLKLNRNCRNSKKIVQYLNKNTGFSIQSFEDMPSGDIIIRQYKNNIEQVKQIRSDVVNLIEKDLLKPNQIVILIHSNKKDSCLANV